MCAAQSNPIAKKVLLTWNSHPKHQRELLHHVREVVNKIAPLGLELKDAWLTVYGEAPEILLGFTPRRGQEDQLEAILRSDEWKEIMRDLSQYIADYEQRVVQASEGFQF
jgi:hypothetical protein